MITGIYMCNVCNLSSFNPKVGNKCPKKGCIGTFKYRSMVSRK